VSVAAYYCGSTTLCCVGGVHCSGLSGVSRHSLSVSLVSLHCCRLLGAAKMLKGMEKELKVCVAGMQRAPAHADG
jgi:hypothetical protein